MKFCVACREPLLNNFCEIGSQYPSAIFLRSESEKPSLKSSSLDLDICSNESCRLVQLVNMEDLNFVYENYPYQTGTTATMDQSLREFVDFSLSQVKLKESDVILDIGGNDGTLLSNFANQNFELINIDLASNIQQVFTDKSYTYVNSKFSYEAYSGVTYKAPKCIFSSAVFYQLPDLEKFCQDIYRLMDSDSTFFLQMTYLGSMYMNNIFDNVVHEHLTYFSLYSLNSLLSRHGLKIVKASLIPLYGGTLRVSVVKDSKSTIVVDESVKNILQWESESRINEPIALTNFGIKFKKWKNEASEIYQKLVVEFGQVIGYGASTKGNMILQALKINNDTMPYIVDNSAKKIGTRTVGSFIPIIGESEFNPANSVIMILPYYYKDFFIEKLQNQLSDGETFISFVPLPNASTEIVRKRNG